MLMSPINPSDINTMEGTYPVERSYPLVVGNEGVGMVIDVGSDVKKIKPNDVVIPSINNFGTWATHRVCRESDVIKVDSQISPLDLSVVSINPCSALRMIEDYVDLKPGDTIVQNAANSHVGLAVIQIAAAKGINTINIVRERHTIEEQMELQNKLQSYGSTICVLDTELSSPEFLNNISKINKPKLALNCVSGDIVQRMTKLLDVSSTIVTYGAMSKKPISMSNSYFIFKDLRMRGFWLNNWIQNNSIQRKEQMYSEICELYRQKKLVNEMVQIMDFDNFSNALKVAQSEKKKGKVVLKF